MVDDAKTLRQLQRIAKLKADRELHKLAVFQTYVAAAQSQVSRAETQLQTCFDAPAPLDVAQLRTANALSGRSARELAKARGELARLRPQFEALRAQAAREYGKTLALDALATELREDQRKTRW